ncbi:MAG: DUF4185 domain-containing protein [Elusimicrobiales bacterium]|nr:DUF4185 domain-containing protein [Elusimicrobiales bacterium]
MPKSNQQPAPAFKTGALIFRAALLLLLPGLACAAEQKPVFPAFEISTGAPLFSQAAATGVVVGQGGNYALALPDGRALWLLNNVMTGERKADGQNAVWDITDGAAALVPSTAPEAQAGAFSWVSDENALPLPLLSGDLGEYTQVRKFWPRSGYCGKERCAVFYSVMNNYGPGPYDYFRVGQGAASSEDPAGPYVKASRGGRYSLWNDIEPAFGSALLEDNDGWLYVYGRVMTAPGEYGAALARVRPGDLLSRDKYSYYGGDLSSATWTSDLAEAGTVLERVPEDFSVSYNDFLKGYLLVYMDDEAGTVFARQARYPWGPWGEPHRLLACSREEYCYGAKEQPAFAADGGRLVYLTVEKKNAPYLYRLRFK